MHHILFATLTKKQTKNHLPHLPSDGMIAVALTSTSARVQWTNGASNGHPIEAYTIQTRGPRSGTLWLRMSRHRSAIVVLVSEHCMLPPNSRILQFGTSNTLLEKIKCGLVNRWKTGIVHRSVVLFTSAPKKLNQLVQKDTRGLNFGYHKIILF